MNPLLDLGLQEHDHTHNVKHEAKNSILMIDPSSFLGGIAIWGALPPVFDTSGLPHEKGGVHVHAREIVGGPKQIDDTYDIVCIYDREGKNQQYKINGDDASNYNISTILGKTLKYLKCPECQQVHSDYGYNAVVPHIKHECEHCGVQFEDSEPSISNAIMLLKEKSGDTQQVRKIIDPLSRSLRVKPRTFKRGMQLWGSNPAVLWTSPKSEEGGVHFHGFQPNKLQPTVDETYGYLTINSIEIDPKMTRYLMAQNALPHLRGLLDSLACPACKKPHFDIEDSAIIPHLIHQCEHCAFNFTAPNGAACVSNPLIATLKSLK